VKLLQNRSVAKEGGYDLDSTGFGCVRVQVTRVFPSLPPFFNPSLVVDGQDAPGHDTFQSDKQIFTQPAKITSLEHHSRWPCGC